MTRRLTRGAITAGVVTCGLVAIASQTGHAQDAALPEKGPVTLVGCLQEGGKHHRYVLANATTNVASVKDAACTATGSENAIKLEGGYKSQLAASVGQWVESSGKLEGRPEEPELRIRSLRPVPIATPRTAEAAPSFPEPPQLTPPRAEPFPAAAPELASKPTATSGVKELPATASPLPLMGLLSVLSLAAGLMLGLFGRPAGD